MFLSFSTCRAYISGKYLGIATHVCVSAIDVMFPSPKGFHGHDGDSNKGQKDGLHNELNYQSSITLYSPSLPLKICTSKIIV